MTIATVGDQRGNEYKSLFSHSDRCYFSLLLPGDLKNNPNQLTTWLENFQSSSSIGENVIVQVKGHFYLSYEAVLKKIQSHSATTIPFLNALVRSNDCNGVALTLPEYMSNLKKPFSIDLQSIKTGASVNNQSKIPIVDFNQLRDTMLEMSSATVLDPSQIEAFAATFSRQIALIQGPPGTGKTYVGTQVVKAMLKNSSKRERSDLIWIQTGNRIVPPPSCEDGLALTPLICVCYTNHALDQFLEGLVNEGVSVDSIVRIGGRSKSQLLVDQSLHELSQRSKTPQEHYRWKQLRESANRCAKAIESYYRIQSEKCIDVNILRTWLNEKASQWQGQMFGELIDNGQLLSWLQYSDLSTALKIWPSSENYQRWSIPVTPIFSLDLATRESLWENLKHEFVSECKER